MFTKYFSTVLFLAACLALPPCYGDTNVLVNPGFEDSNGWAARGCTFTYTTAQKHSGSQSGKAAKRTATWQGIKQSILGKVENGKTYRISCWVRLENAASADVMISVEQKDANGTKYRNIASQAANNKDWIQLSGGFIPNAAGTLEVLDIYIEGPPADVNFYVDDLEVSEFIPPSTTPAAPPAKPTDPNAAGKVSTLIHHQINHSGRTIFYILSNQNIIKEEDVC